MSIMIEIEKVYWLKERNKSGGADLMQGGDVIARLNRNISTSLQVAIPNAKLLELTNTSKTMLEILESFKATMIEGYAVLPYVMKPLFSGRIDFKEGKNLSIYRDGLIAWFLRRKISDVDGSQGRLVLVCEFVDDTGFPICTL